MFKVHVRLAIALGCALLSGCNSTTTQVIAASAPPAPAQPTARPVLNIPGSTLYHIVDRIVTKDTDTMLGDWAIVDVDCSTEKFQVLRIQRKPGHGTADLRDYRTHPSFVSTNPRSKCNERQITATSLHYRADPGFTGFDSLLVMISGPYGKVMNTAFRIRVVD